MDAVKSQDTSLFTTDACPNNLLQSVQHLQGLTNDVRVWKQMEADLEEFEKVALVFLLAAEYPDSYVTVLSLCRGTNDHPGIISEYMQSKPEIETEKLIEALCIIGNHAVLANLGYSRPQELAASYNARIPRLATKVKPAVKVLYKLFESMDSEKTEKFLQSIYKESRITRQLDTRYLELHALHWLHEKYITIAVDGTANFGNLLKHLKSLGYYSETIYHDVEHFGNTLSTPSRALSVDDSCTQNKQAPPSIRHEPHVRTDIRIEDEKNRARTIKKGFCFIINEVDYESDCLQYKNRHGSNCDRDNLITTFSRRNFDVKVEENLNKRGMQKMLKQLCQNFDVRQYDCLVICILSHGYEGGIVTCDGQEMSIKQVEYEMCTNKLCDVIKILIVQACQGDSLGDMSEVVSSNISKAEVATDGRIETDSETTELPESDLSIDGPTEKLPPYNHFCRFMSTMDRFLSIRHIKEGTWFIEAICQELSKDERISISDWELAVKANVQGRRGLVNGVKTASQLPEFSSRLPTRVYFPPYVSS